MRSRVIRRLTATFTVALALLAGIGLNLQPADGDGNQICVGATGMVACVPPD